MIRKCKHVDITDRAFIKKAINECMSRKNQKKRCREDIVNFYAECGNKEENVITVLQTEIKERKLKLIPIRYSERIDKSNGKIRTLAIESIKQQFYDYIAYDGLEELASCIGHYQIACKKKMGPVFGAHVIQEWMKDKNVRYGIKADVRKCYPSITHENIMKWLRRRVANDTLLWLIETLLETFHEGLPIGSYLSIRLNALYLSDIYHRCEDHYFVERREKKQNVVAHVMINLDDIYIFGSNAKAMNRMMRDLVSYAREEKDITIKETWTIINLNPKDENSHFDALGYRIYHDRITMRHRNYIKFRQAIKDFKKHRTVVNARNVISYDGMFRKHTNSTRFDRKYNVYMVVREARRIISDYDKSKIPGKAAGDSGIFRTEQFSLHDL